MRDILSAMPQQKTLSERIQLSLQFQIQLHRQAWERQLAANGHPAPALWIWARPEPHDEAEHFVPIKGDLPARAEDMVASVRTTFRRMDGRAVMWVPSGRYVKLPERTVCIQIELASGFRVVYRSTLDESGKLGPFEGTEHDDVGLKLLPDPELNERLN